MSAPNPSTARGGYADFLARKQRRVAAVGRPVTSGEVHPFLHPWQRQVTAWAVERGRAALWEYTGLGKTVQQVEWARLSAETSLIVAPLAVCQQTVREASKVDVPAVYVRDPAQVTGPGVWVTSYEMASRFPPGMFGAVVLDEASILKQHDGATRRMLTQHFASVPRRLACTATPAPNDVEELCTQAEFLGVMPRAEMLAAYFIHDSDGWRLKGHARTPMFEWMASWAIALRSPADLGYSDDGYHLPPLNVRSHTIQTGIVDEGALFGATIGGIGGRARARKSSVAARVERAVELVAGEPGEPWLLWCGLNAEAAELAKAIPGAVNVEGSWAPEAKADAFLAFADQQIPVMITKPGIAAFGLNWQHCARMAFVGLSDSWEAYFQAIRRCWRYGQSRPVDVHIIISDVERAVLENVLAKERHATSLVDELVAAMTRARSAA